MPMPLAGAVHLGKTVPLASAAANTPTVVFGKGYIKLWIYHYIAGYSTSTIALIQFGTGSTIDTGNNYSSWATLLGTSSTTGTSTASTNGVKVAQDNTANGRRGLHEVWNLPGEPTMIDARTNTFSTTDPTTAGASQASASVVFGHWWPTTEAECVRMNGGAGNLRQGSYIDVWGIPTAA